jgi:protoporphyrinogen oxidase
MYAGTDEDLTSSIKKDLQLLFGLRGPLEEVRTHRWPAAIPVYNKQVLEIKKALELGWCSQPGRIVFGNYTGQVSIRGMIETLHGSLE